MEFYIHYRDNPVLDPLAALHQDNFLTISFFFLKNCLGLRCCSFREWRCSRAIQWDGILWFVNFKMVPNTNVKSQSFDQQSHWICHKGIGYKPLRRFHCIIHWQNHLYLPVSLCKLGLMQNSLQSGWGKHHILGPLFWSFESNHLFSLLSSNIHDIHYCKEFHRTKYKFGARTKIIWEEKLVDPTIHYMFLTLFY